MGDRLRIDLTGQVSVEDGDRVLAESELPGRQGRLVLAFLALRGEPVHRDVLADLLWPGGVPATWERTLSGVISRLRSAFAAGGFDDLSIANAFGCYELQRPPEAILDIEIAADETRFAERAMAGGDLAQASASARRAIEIARRSLLAGEEGEWLDAARLELRSQLVRALDVLAEASLGSADSVDAAKEAIELEPFRETSHVLLMRAYAALGSIGDALLAYERCRDVFSEELGIDPSPEIRNLHVALLRADEDALIASATSQGLVSLPTTTNTFIGRTAELGAVFDLVTAERLITLTGPGGVGKTRLAIEIARSAIASFPDGVRFVDLASLTASAPIIEHVALALGLNLSEEASAGRLGEILGTQRVLLLLDNCEHVAEQVRELVVDLLDTASGPVVLVTSRSPLGVAEEHAWDVPSLAVPDSDARLDEVGSADSVALFCARASQARPGFALTAANAAFVVSICSYLDGLPLAIELAATRVGSLSVAEIAERLADRLSLETNEGVLRHRTLRTVIDWSYDQLGAREAATFRRLAAFEGMFPGESAAAVCGVDAEPSVTTLLRHSLLRREDAGGCYRMLETVRQYARERARQAGEWEGAVQQHIRWYVELFHNLSTNDLVAFTRAGMEARLEATAALRRALERNLLDDALALARFQRAIWFRLGLAREGRTLLEETVVRAAREERSNDVVDLIVWLARFARTAGDEQESRRLLSKAMDMSRRNGDDRTRVEALVCLASSPSLNISEIDEAAREALALGTAIDHPGAVAAANLILSGVAAVAGRYEESADYARAARDASTLINDRDGIANAMIRMAHASRWFSGDDSWRNLIPAALQISRESGSRVLEASCLAALGWCHTDVGEYVVALDHLRAALRHQRRRGDPNAVLGVVADIARVLAEIGDPKQAWALIAAYRTLPEKLGLWPPQITAEEVDRIRSRAGSAGDEAWRQGAEFTFDEAYELALNAEVQVSSVVDASSV